jgi:hypothetical protein
VVFGDGQGEGGGVDLEMEPVSRVDRVAVELHRWTRSQRISTLPARRVSTVLDAVIAWLTYREYRKQLALTRR